MVSLRFVDESKPWLDCRCSYLAGREVSSLTCTRLGTHNLLTVYSAAGLWTMSITPSFLQKVEWD